MSTAEWLIALAVVVLVMWHYGWPTGLITVAFILYWFEVAYDGRFPDSRR